MMLLEMNAYVGDVLSFYIDQQYREMLLPLAEERRNVINIAKSLGYKVKPTIPAYVELTITQNVETNNGLTEKAAENEEKTKLCSIFVSNFSNCFSLVSYFGLSII